MALLPTHQFYPRATRLQFIRYSSSGTFKKQSLCETNSKIFNPESSSGKTHHIKSNFVPRNNARRWGFQQSDNDCSWLGKWNESYKHNKLKRPQIVLNYRNSGEFSGSDGEDSDGGRTMEKIVLKLKKIGYTDIVSDKDKEVERVIEKGSVEDIFHVEEGMLPNTRGGFSEKHPLGDESVFYVDGEIRFPWEQSMKEEERYSVRPKSRIHLAQVTLPAPQLKRLINLALQIKTKTRITGAGVNQQVVETIHEKWKSTEVVRLKIEGNSALNMKRVHEILERKTGGLVIWRSGTSVALYRGVSYESPEKQKKRMRNKNDNSSLRVDKEFIENPLESALDNLSTPDESKDIEGQVDVKYDDEVDRLLEGLGPRYLDWHGDGPLPVDGDLLPGIIPGYEPPFRVLPYGVRSTLGNTEATALRRLARTLPPHFAIGRSRQHQGLASAMIKLWERCSVAKVALKHGVQLTTSERMADHIKKLTGGILLSRNKDFMVFYRGKDFLSREVAEALLEKERVAKAFQNEEEKARLRASVLVTPNVHAVDSLGMAGTLGETLDANAKWGKTLDESDKEIMTKEAEMLRHANLVRKLERNLAFAERKVERAERALSKVEESLKPLEQSADRYGITDEERFMFRKLGSRMKAFLLLGRRGVFSGTVENMHLHWKYRELVKIIVKAKNIEQVKNIALALEAESGGVLVSVDKVSKGYSIIVFRGKGYQRPSTIRPKNLLTKRKALARSVELQRREAVLKHIEVVKKRVERLKTEIEEMNSVKDDGDEELYEKLESVYPTDDEESEEEAGVEGYYSDDELVDGRESLVYSETNFQEEEEDDDDEDHDDGDNDDSEDESEQVVEQE
ncbi:unnamed protein product [Cuscuta campestris]|uniref:CRM domain-containing protein n=1 Tax=Cuscuta campestris TaxID=132261 RepID=A0A484MGA2_9ASTE|nr:unnamed protein product [Cuscuta campestris]